MKDMQATLRRIDEEIIGHNQQIARSRVEIGRLQETRLVLMSLAEGDAAAAQADRQERQGLLNGAHARPVLIVRKTGSGDDPSTSSGGSASKEAKPGLNRAGNRRGMGNNKGRKPGTKNEKPSARGMFMQRVLDLLADATEPMSSQEMGNYFGLSHSIEARKPLHNALWWMRNSGLLDRDADKRYSLSRQQPQP